MSRQEMGPEVPTPRDIEQEPRTTTVTRERGTAAGPITWDEMRAMLRREPEMPEEALEAGYRRCPGYNRRNLEHYFRCRHIDRVTGS